MLIGAKRNAIAAMLISGCAVVAGCGGGGRGTTGSAPVASVGALIDSPVAGLGYRTATQSGITDGIGNFKYLPGEVVAFSVAGVMLFSAPAASVVTPLDGTGLDATSQSNLLRLLQTLDHDGNPANGIEIVSSLTGMPNTLDLGSATFDTDVSAFLTAAQSAGWIPSTTLVSAIDAQTNFDKRNSIVGAWYHDFNTNSGQAKLPIALTFLSDGTYLMADDSNTTATDPSGQPGIEVGTYIYDPSTGAFSSTCPSINSDGEWGLSHPTPGSCTGSTATVTITGDTMVFTDSTPGSTPFTFTLTRVIDATKSIVGSWHHDFNTTLGQPKLPIALTFLSDGTYLMADDSNTTAVDPSGQPGIEVGAYTYDPSTGAFSSTCPSINTDGEWGLSNPIPVGGCTGTTANVTITGNTMVFTDSAPGSTPITLTRVTAP